MKVDELFPLGEAKREVQETGALGEETTRHRERAEVHPSLGDIQTPGARRSTPFPW